MAYERSLAWTDLLKSREEYSINGCVFGHTKLLSGLEGTREGNGRAVGPDTCLAKDLQRESKQETYS